MAISHRVRVTMAGRIKQYGDPWGGGWMTWPAGLITRLMIAENITSAFQSFVRGTESGAISGHGKSRTRLKLKYSTR